MARKYRSKNTGSKSQGAIIIIVALVALIILIIKVILVLLPFILVGFIGYKYYQWQNARLLEYNNDWDRFYQEELKHKLHLWASSLTIAFGAIIIFVRPWVGIPIALIGLLIFPKLQNWLLQIFSSKYNNWTKGTIIASLLTAAFAANGVYGDILEKKIAQQVKLEKIKNDETEQINKEKQIQIDSANYFVQLALKSIKDKKYNIAEDNLRKAIDLDAENQNAFYYRGLIFQSKGKYNKALEEYIKVGKVTDLQAGEIEYQKGQCYIKIGKKEEALSAFFNSANLGFERGHQFYDKYKPKPKPTPKITNKTTPSSSSYSSGENSRRSGACLAGQCIAYTKKGYRCSRTTTNCSGKCWQH